jgi:hypothetical protein
MNEPDGWRDFANNNWAPPCTLYNDCAVTMNAVDPTIEVGRSTIAWYNDKPADMFVTSCWSNVGFQSWHIYVIGLSVIPPLNGPLIYHDVMQRIPRRDRELLKLDRRLLRSELRATKAGIRFRRLR